MHGYRDAFLASAAISVIGVVCSFLIHDEDAAASMERRARPAKVEPVGAAAREGVLVTSAQHHGAND
jgi:hypothetical protein